MADAKIEIKVGAVSFIGEGTEKWLSEQLEKMLEKLPELADAAPASNQADGGSAAGTGSPARGSQSQGTLAKFLTDKNATSNQIRKFLATAIWVIDKGKHERIATADVTKALSDNHQRALGNADCLNKNVRKGFCEKAGREFFVTDEGRADIG
jgi:hypothetical protein